MGIFVKTLAKSRTGKWCNSIFPTTPTTRDMYGVSQQLLERDTLADRSEDASQLFLGQVLSFAVTRPLS